MAISNFLFLLSLVTHASATESANTMTEQGVFNQVRRQDDGCAVSCVCVTFRSYTTCA